MNRKTTIIISLTGIVVIILALIGFTYGFYVAKIYGNENAKSVEITTADSKIQFIDLSQENEEIRLSLDESFSKSFTVENIGEGSARYYVALTNVINTFNRKEDIRYNLYRVGYNKNQTELNFPTDLTTCVSKTDDTFKTNCTLVVDNGEYPATNLIISPKEELPTPGNIYKYLLVVTYINQPDINQDEDKGKVVAGKVQISSFESIDNFNPYNYDTSLLSYNIINNAQNDLDVDYNKTDFIEPGEQDGINYSIPAQQAIFENERVLTYTIDDYGTSYYYRGDVEDNFVLFSGMCWRIVRIEGNGGIKLIFAGNSNNCVITNDDIITAGFNGTDDYVSNYKPVLDTWLNGGTISGITYENKIDVSELTTKLTSSYWCQDFSIYEYYTNPDFSDIRGADYNWEYRIASHIPSLKCDFIGLDDTNSSKIISNIGLLTEEEYVFAGSSLAVENDLYLYISRKDTGYLADNIPEYSYSNFISLSPMNKYGDRQLSGTSYYVDVYLRPSIVLKENTTIVRGNGTIDNPYIVE